jgi:Zn-dependent protease
MSSFSERMQILSIEFLPFIAAVVFRECGRAWMARRLGDPTAEQQGRISLNPLVHLDPIGTLIFPLLHLLTGMNLFFGWAKPVPIEPRKFKNYRKGVFWVSVAGVGTNFFLAFSSAILFCALSTWLPRTFYFYEPLVSMAYIAVGLNYALGVFHLIPLPPLDGSKILQSFLSHEATLKYESIAPYSFFILMALLFSGVLSLLSRPIHFLTENTLNFVSFLF